MGIFDIFLAATLQISEVLHAWSSKKPTRYLGTGKGERFLLLGHNNEIPNGFQNIVTEVCTDVYLKSNLNFLINIVI